MPLEFNRELWGDIHTYYLNKLYSIYHKETIWDQHLYDIGYRGFPDPIFYLKSDNFLTPDFLAIGMKEKDVQIIDIKGFQNIEKNLNSQEEVEEKIASKIMKIRKYEKINKNMISHYLSYRQIDFKSNKEEIIALIPSKIYQKYTKSIKEGAGNKIIVWVIESNKKCYIWKAHGSHLNPVLNDFLDSKNKGISIYPGREDLIRFTRNTPKKIIKFCFIEKMMTYCSRKSIKKFNFDEIDSILTRTDLPMFPHLLRKEREEIWRYCMHTMMSRFHLIKKGRLRNQYEWDKSRFLEQPMDRNSILENIAKKLKIGVHE